MKRVVAWLLEHACRITHHVGGCWLLNREALFFYDEERDAFRVAFKSPTYRLWCWSMDLPRGSGGCHL